MFFDEDYDAPNSDDEGLTKRHGLIFGAVLSAWLLVIVVSGQGEIRAHYDACIAAGGNTVQCAQEQGGP